MSSATIDTARHSHKVMELPDRPILRSETGKVEEHQHPLMSEEDSDSDIDGHPRTYPSFNPKATGTSSPIDKARELLNLKLLRHENQQLFDYVHLPHPPQTTPSRSGMTSAQSPAPSGTVSCPSCITHPNFPVVEGHHHPLTLEEDLDLTGHWPSVLNFISNVVRTASPPPTEEDRAELAVRRLALKKLRRKLTEELPGFEKGGREEVKVVVKPYVPCEFHKGHPPSFWRPDLIALGLQFKQSERSFHGGVSECCDWRRFRASAPKEELEKETQKFKAEEGGIDEKPEMKEKSNDEFTEKTGGELKDDADEVTYFTFVTDFYFAEASWPEILAANGLRKRWVVSREPPFSIERIVGTRVERTYTGEEIEAGCIETEEALWWERKRVERWIRRSEMRRKIRWRIQMVGDGCLR